MNKDYIITIGRQYGCGGRSIGKLISEKLGIEYYDNELISIAAQKSGVSQGFVASFDEKPKKFATGFFSMGTAQTGSFYPVYDNIVMNDKVFVLQSDIIRQAAESPCVIVGRCADYVLKNKPNLVRVFLYADMEARKDRIINKYGVEYRKNIEKAIAKADKQRAGYYNTYTDQTWSAATSYDLCVNTSKLTLEAVADLIIKYTEQLEASKA